MKNATASSPVGIRILKDIKRKSDEYCDKRGLKKSYHINKSDLFHSYKNYKLHFLEKFSQDIINRIDNIIMNSKLIAPKYLSKIIYDYHSGNQLLFF